MRSLKYLLLLNNANNMWINHGSLPFFEQKKCSETASEHVRIETGFLQNDPVPIASDEIQNSFDELEDKRPIPYYDHALLDSIDSRENESYSNDKNNDNTEPHVMI